MPTYAYACTACSHEFDAVQSFSEDSLTDCPECAGRLRKKFGAVGVVFKGSGFYRTDSRNGAGAPAAAKTSDKSGDASSSTGSSASDSGSATKTDTGSGSSSASGDKGSSSNGASSTTKPAAGSSTSGSSAA